jgi:hypothetical protein
MYLSFCRLFMTPSIFFPAITYYSLVSNRERPNAGGVMVD